MQQQAQRWLRAGSFEALADDLRLLLRLATGRNDAPSATILDDRTLQSTPENGARAGYDGANKRKVHAGWIRWAICRRSKSLRPKRTGPRASRSPGSSGASGNERKRATGVCGARLRGTLPAPLRRPTGCSWKSWNMPKQNGVSCCYCGAGSWSGPSLGPHASAAWPPRLRTPRANIGRLSLARPRHAQINPPQKSTTGF